MQILNLNCFASNKMHFQIKYACIVTIYDSLCYKYSTVNVGIHLFTFK